MKIHVFWFSPLYHTRLVALTLAEGLKDAIETTPRDASSSGSMLAAIRQSEKVFLEAHDITTRAALPSINQLDIVLLAIPVYAGRVPPLAAGRLQKIRGNGAGAILVATYGNRAYDDALAELRDITEKMDCKPGWAAACVCRHTIADYAAGRPNADDLAEIREFGASVARKLTGSPQRVAVPGNVPTDPARTFCLPQTVNDNCAMCGHCWEECPGHAIKPGAPAEVDRSRCICCMRCVGICPENARVPEAAFIEGIRQKIGPACEKPKRNEFFGV